MIDDILGALFGLAILAIGGLVFYHAVCPCSFAW